MNETSVGALAAGMMLGGAAVWMYTQNKRTMRRAMKHLAHGAESAMVDLDKMICRCGR